MLTNIPAANWPTSGTATPATTGLATLTGTGLIHVGSTDVPIGSNANGYVEANQDAVVSVGVDSFANAIAASNVYSQTFWARFRKTGTVVNGVQARFLDVNGNGVRVILSTYSSNDENGVAGLNMFSSNISGGGVVGNLDVQSSSGSTAFIPYDKWMKITLDFDCTIGNLSYRFMVNGQVVTRATGYVTDGTNQLPEIAELALQASGAKVQICGPFVSDNNRTEPIVPLVRLRPNSKKLTQVSLPMSFTDEPRGVAFRQTLAGTTSTRTSYATGGVNPRRKRQILGGSGTATFDSISVGELPFNESGWCTIAFPMLYLAGAGASSIAVNLRNAAGDATIVSLSMDGTNLVENAINRCQFGRASRYAVLLHLSISGESALTLLDQTNSGTSQYAWSAKLSGWTPQDIGSIQVVAIVASGDAPEVDGCFIGPYCDVIGIDSLSHAPVATTPVLANVNNLAGISPTKYYDIHNVPGSMGYDLDDFSQVTIPVGRSGRNAQDQWDNVAQYLQHTRAVRYIAVDGGSINDIPSIDNTNRAVKFATWKGNVFATVMQYLSRGNRVWIMTMIRREQGTYTATQLREIDAMNGYMRCLAQSAQRYVGGTPLLQFSDPAYGIDNHASLFTSGDDTHFNAAGNITVYDKMISTRTTATQAVGVGTMSSADVRVALSPELASITAIKSKTDNLPTAPAAVGSVMTLATAYDSAKTAASQASVDAQPKYGDTTKLALVLDSAAELQVTLTKVVP